MRTTEETSEYSLSFNDDPETHKRVYDMALSFFKEHRAFSGECIMQSDRPQVDTAPFLSDLADDVFQFERKWKE